MPTNKKKKGGNKAKASAKSNAANKDDLAGLDDLLSNPEQMAAAQREAVANGTGYKPRTGKENAQIGLKGFTQATQNPAMFSDAMSMLGDPGAVKEAEAMMNDPEFKSEISAYMDTLKNNSAFREAMAEAQRKYQALMADPVKMKEATEKYEALMKQRQQQQQPHTQNDEASSPAAGEEDGNTGSADVQSEALSGRQAGESEKAVEESSSPQAGCG